MSPYHTSALRLQATPLGPMFAGPDGHTMCQMLDVLGLRQSIERPCQFCTVFRGLIFRVVITGLTEMSTRPFFEKHHPTTCVYVTATHRSHSARIRGAETAHNMPGLIREIPEYNHRANLSVTTVWVKSCSEKCRSQLL